MLKNLYEHTPTFLSKSLSARTGKNIYLKMECFQPTGSFKIRGLSWLCQKLVSEGCEHLVCSSGGNAGYAVAYVGEKLGVPVTVFVPKSTNPIFLHHLSLTPAAVNVRGEVWDEAHEAALEYLPKVKGGYIPPFDHPVIWSGHATMIDEIVMQCEPPDAVIAAVGGGGLLCGVLAGLARHGWADVDIFAVETEGAASFATGMHVGRPVTLDTINTVATSLGAKRVTAKLFEWSQQRKITPLVVSDRAAVNACRNFVDDHFVLVEPACGAALSVIYGKEPLKKLEKAQSILVIVCGGVGISMDLLSRL